METKGINILEEALKNYNGADVLICTSHKLWGDQKVKCELDAIFDHRIGFRAKNGQEIFIYRESIIDCGIEDYIYFADELMQIKIKLNEAV